MVTSSRKEYVDFLDDFLSGINTGIEPRLLGKEQLAWGINLSLRGGFAHSRPPYVGKVINYNGNAALQSLVQQGLFQGAGYYRPDYGTEIIVAAISGHILLFIETTAGGSWNISDVTISGDPMSSTVPQIWMFQAEKWMIINDGTEALPYFFNGTSCRRSTGASVVLGTIANDYQATGNIGNIVTLTLTSPYTGAYNVPVIFNGEFYLPVQVAPPATTNPGTYPALLTNLGDTTDITFPVGTVITTNTLNAGTLQQSITLPAGESFLRQSPTDTSHPGKIFVAAALLPCTPGYITLVDGIGQITTFYLQSTGMIIYPLSQPVITAGPTDVTWASGQPINYVTPNPSVAVATVAAQFTVPAVGGSVTVQLTSQYSGAANQSVLINGQSYSISPAPATPTTTAGNTLLMINQTDTKTNLVSAAAVDGSNNIVSVPELPAGRMGAYGMGCICLCLANGTQYVIGDVLGAGSGTQAENYRDAVLKMTQNSFLLGGGAFSIPLAGSGITAMKFPPTLDTSLGQGPLQIGTDGAIFSNYVVGTYPGNWDTLTSPIQTESLKDNGPLGQNSTILVNSDTFFRSAIGIGTLILARREFYTWGNVPVSNEVREILNQDDPSLLQFGSAASFDNRFFCTADPANFSNGVAHVGLVSLNFDLISTLSQKQPPVWEGAWTGINAMQILTGKINGGKRAIAFSYNLLSKQTELYELLPESTTLYADNASTPIQWIFETPVCFNKDVKPLASLIQLQNGEVYLSDIQGKVTVQVFYKPDYYPKGCWVPWTSFSVCQSTDSANSQPGWQMRIGLGSPDATACEPNNNRPFREGYFFQFRFVITGACTFKGMKLYAVEMPQPLLPPAMCGDGPCQASDCVPTDDLHSYSLQSPPLTPATPPPIVPPPAVFSNQIVYFPYQCSLGAPVLTYSATTPTWITLDSNGSQSPGGVSGLIGAAGVFFGATQAAANAAAQSALNTFGNTAVAAGTLYCTTPAPSDLLNLVWQTAGWAVTSAPGTWPPTGFFLEMYAPKGAVVSIYANNPGFASFTTCYDNDFNNKWWSFATAMYFNATATPQTIRVNFGSGACNGVNPITFVTDSGINGYAEVQVFLQDPSAITTTFLCPSNPVQMGNLVDYINSDLSANILAKSSQNVFIVNPCNGTASNYIDLVIPAYTEKAICVYFSFKANGEVVVPVTLQLL